ncbi:MAG: VCBS repeat-containing protein [Methanobacteriota archaeon]|nr:MAG: VCBS repeat-containing protein [Euryarchaeota archaeon]
MNRFPLFILPLVLIIALPSQAQTDWTPMTPINTREGITFSHPAFLPYTFQSRPDLFMGSEDGTIYHQPIIKANRTVVEFGGFEAGLITALFPRGAPFAYDMNKDGLDDLIIGDQQGKVHLLLQTPSGSFILNDSFVKGIQVSQFAKPTAGDIDGDGKDEIIVGEGNGSLVVFFNRGTLASPSWEIDRSLFNFPLGEHPAPFAFKPTSDSQISDLVIGTERFGIIYVKNLSKDGKTAFEVIQFTNGGNPFREIDFGSNTFLTPSLVDLDGDSNLDLVVGTKDGHLEVFRNSGIDFLTVQREAGLNQTIIVTLVLLLFAVSGVAIVFYLKGRPQSGQPIYLMLVHSSGVTPFSYSFSRTEVEDDALAGGAFAGVSTIISEITSGSLESLDLGDRKILVSRVPFLKDPNSELLVLLWATNDDPHLRKLTEDLAHYVASNFEDIFTLGEITDEFTYKTEARIETLFQKYLETENNK